MQHLISYDLARGIHIIAVTAWISGMLMLPRIYCDIITLSPSDETTSVLLRSAKHVRTLILTPFMLLAWALGIFLFCTYFASDWEAPLDRLASVPAWFWAKLALALFLTFYHGLLVDEGRRLAATERRRSAAFWRLMTVLPFAVASLIVLLATVEPYN